MADPAEAMRAVVERYLGGYGLTQLDRMYDPVTVAPTCLRLQGQAIPAIEGSGGGIVDWVKYTPEGTGVPSTLSDTLEHGNAGFSEPLDYQDSKSFQFEKALYAYNLAVRRFNQVAQRPELGYVPVTPVSPRRLQPTVDDKERERLFSRLMYSLGEEAVEDGMSHPAEDIIAEALSSERWEHVMAWLADFSTDIARPTFAASVLKCLGRHEDAGTESWRLNLVLMGLNIDDVEIRDAAVQAAEQWGGRGMIGVLEAHAEPERWLRRYIRDVIDDLKE